MTSSIFHGIKTNLLQTGARPINPVSTAIIGMVCTASDADADIFPLDRPVLVAAVRSAIGSAGTQGTLAKALATIADQCSPTVIVVRVATPTDPTEQEALVVGTSTGGTYTGMKALLMAQAITGFRPRSGFTMLKTIRWCPSPRRCAG